MSTWLQPERQPVDGFSFFATRLSARRRVQGKGAKKLVVPHFSNEANCNAAGRSIGPKQASRLT